jgi:hypothetical protein
MHGQNTGRLIILRKMRWWFAAALISKNLRMYRACMRRFRSGAWRRIDLIGDSPGA